MTPGDWLSGKWFNLVHRHNLVYNTCWEDPRLDRAALDLGPDDTVLVITSAGCNVLDYALQGPRHVHAVDMNPRQNALLELKLAGLRRLDHPTFFSLFGRGRLDGFPDLYRGRLRASGGRRRRGPAAVPDTRTGTIHDTPMGIALLGQHCGDARKVVNGRTQLGRAPP
jgi:hypothetical protein